MEGMASPLIDSHHSTDMWQAPTYIRIADHPRTARDETRRLHPVDDLDAKMRAFVYAS